ncbi:ABC transporter permease [Clostridium oryzae]|uniref:ABC-2 family transporter protein n=1 Tax=Clostridium oryzae TaxID=1450648 RepID=A0A1V4IY09_9CLOT|nr:ABC transporter permease [Clostridium oryzae]OPJ64665.1 hypothetical protein CLORY_05350 [Clostridium oryzae]
MKAYLSFFRIRFIHGLQYRAAAYAGIITQLAFGLMYIMLYSAFYENNITATTMSFSQLSSYLWLQQAFLALFMTWFLDNDIFDLITGGNVAYELCRPLDLYAMWFSKSCAVRLSKAVLRCFPILIIAFFMPEPYKLHLPNSIYTLFAFIASMILAFMLVVAYCMLIYILCFYTISPMGIRMAMIMLADFFSGSLVPLPLMPDWFNKYSYILPFAAMQNVPFRIYSGNISIEQVWQNMLVQLIWLIILIILGRFILSRALKRTVVQGG